MKLARYRTDLVVLLVGAVTLATAPALAPLRAEAQAPPPPPRGAPAPTTDQGSLAPDVYFEDISYTTRLAFYRTATVSRHDPNVAYVGSYEGYVWKTTDGGKTWDEFRLIVEPRPYHGDGGQRLYFGVHRSDGSGKIVAPEELDAKRNKWAVEDKYRWADKARVDDESGGGGDSGRGAAANVNFGIGVPGGAPRLQLVVRKFGKPTSGLNIKQTLLYVGTRPTEVRMIVEHPTDPKTVFACTAFGLFVTYDGGLNWVRTFVGTSPRGWFASHVAVDPLDDKRVFLATGEGLYISEDGGQNFLKSTKKGVGEGWISWVYFYPHDSRYVFVCTDYGLLRSSDGGESWEWTYFTTFPAGRVVTHMEIDPFDPKKGYIATFDGLYYTNDILEGGLEEWKRLGGLQFTGVNMFKITACPRHKGHLWTQTIMRLPKPTALGWHDTGGAFVMESLDGGTNWTPIFAGNTDGSIQWFDNHPTDPDLLWLIWSRSMTRMRRRTGPAMAEKMVVPDDPPIGEVIMAALRYTGTEAGRQLGYRKLSQLKALVPSVTATVGQVAYDDYLIKSDGLLPTLPYHRNVGIDTGFFGWEVMLNWDLAPLVFNLDTALFGRVDRVNGEIRWYLQFAMHRFYGELRRLRVLLANKPPEDLRVRLIYKLRVEELESYINMMTGGYLKRWQRGGHPPGMDARWWEPWNDA